MMYVTQPTNPCVENTRQIHGRSPDVRNAEVFIHCIAINSPNGQALFKVVPGVFISIPG